MKLTNRAEVCVGLGYGGVFVSPIIIWFEGGAIVFVFVLVTDVCVESMACLQSMGCRWIGPCRIVGCLRT